MYRAYGEISVQLSVDIMEAETKEDALHAVSVDINEITSNMKEITVTTVEGKEYRLNINGFRVNWEELIKKSNKLKKKKA